MESLLDKCDTLILNGEMIFAFYKAQDLSVGSFPVDDENVNLAKSILDKAKSKRVKILLPSQVVVVDRFTYYGKNKVVAASAIPDGWTGVDIGPESVDLIKNALDSAKTVMWEGAETYEFGKFSRASEVQNFLSRTLECHQIIGWKRHIKLIIGIHCIQFQRRSLSLVTRE